MRKTKDLFVFKISDLLYYISLDFCNSKKLPRFLDSR